MFLQRHNDLIPQHKQHLIEKEPSFFEQQPFANIEMWKRHLDIVLDPTHTPQRGKITQYFRKPTHDGQQQRKQRQTKETPKVKKKKKKPNTLPSDRYPLASIILHRNHHNPPLHN